MRTLLVGLRPDLTFDLVSWTRQRVEDRVESAIQVGTDLLLVHRDAENQTADIRIREIQREVNGRAPYVPIVPIRMTEAWLLLDENAIRRASGNPRGRIQLELPTWRQVERLADPKLVLRDKLLLASETTGRRRDEARRQFGHMRRTVAREMGNYDSLRRLCAVQDFLRNAESALQSLRPL